MEKRTVKDCNVFVEPIKGKTRFFGYVTEVRETKKFVIIRNDTGLHYFRKTNIEFYVCRVDEMHVFCEGGE